MRIERLEGNRKIRVRLTSDDLTYMNINVAMLHPDSPELQRFLFRIMEQIKRETGFRTAGGKIMVEAAPVNGGVVLTVTRLDILPSAPAGSTKVRAKLKRQPELVFRFAGFDAMCAYLCAAPDEKLEPMRLFSYDKNFFAVTNVYDERLREFSGELIGTSGERFLREHATLIVPAGEVPQMARRLRELKN